MSTPDSQKKLDILNWFSEKLAVTAQASGLLVEHHEALASSVFRGGTKQESAQIQSIDLPTRVTAVKLGRHSVLLGELPASPSTEAIEDLLRRFRNQAVIARSYLNANEALDLQVFLVGPLGSEASDKWSTLALLIERDEKVARKLAWLRPEKSVNDEKSYREFIGRTFLAQPWIYDHEFVTADLDGLSRIPELSDASLPRNTAQAWVQLTFQHHDDAVTLVDSLIEAWSKRGKE
jgi:hypothetical protein